MKHNCEALRRTIARLTLVIAALVALTAPTGCDGGEEAPESDSPSPASSSQAPSLPEAITPAGADRVSISERLLTRIPIGDPSRGPDWMVSAFGSLWVKRDDGIVVRIDPESSKIVAEIGKPGPLGHVCQGIGASRDAIWSCPPSDAIQRIDPGADSVAETLSVKKFPEQGRIVSAADRVWVLTRSGAELTAIDPRTNRPAQSFALDRRCGELAAARETLWITCPLDDRLLRFDARSGEVSGELELAGATNASIADELWVGFDEGVAQIDPETLEVLAVYDLYPSYGGSIFAGRGAVWVREEAPGIFLTRIDPRSRRIVEQIKAPELPSGGDVVEIGDSVWASAYDDATVVELAASSR